MRRGLFTGNSVSQAPHKIIFLVGPTAIGKTEIGAQLAKKINAEIISCDSMQIYKDMDILTSKPALKLRRKIPHHLLDTIPVSKECNVFKYRSVAIRKINEITRKGKIPVFVGGSGLYVSVVVDGIFKAAGEDPAIRKCLYQEAENFGSRYIYEKLKKADPEAAEKIHPNDTRRIVRALEVFKVTSKPISQLKKERSSLDDKYDTRIFGLTMPRNALNKRIDGRIDLMFKQGLIVEVKKLLKHKLSKTARCAIGINEIKGFIDGLYDLREAKRLMKRNTRNYAKRQLSWFKRDKRIQWIELKENQSPKQISELIFDKLHSKKGDVSL